LIQGFEALGVQGIKEKVFERRRRLRRACSGDDERIQVDDKLCSGDEK